MRFEWGMAIEDHKKAVESFQADHQRHTEIAHRAFTSLFIEPMTSPVLKSRLRLIGDSK